MRSADGRMLLKTIGRLLIAMGISWVAVGPVLFHGWTHPCAGDSFELASDLDLVTPSHQAVQSRLRLTKLPKRVINTTFLDCDLSEADLKGVELSGVHFLRCRLDGLRASDGCWVEVECRDCCGRGADFSQSRFFNCTWSHCSVPESTWHATTHLQTCFEHGTLPTSSWSDCCLHQTRWSHCDLQDSMWHQSDLRDCLWNQCDLRESCWWDCRGADSLVEEGLLQDTTWIESWQPDLLSCQHGHSGRPRIYLPWRSSPPSAYKRTRREHPSPSGDRDERRAKIFTDMMSIPKKKRLRRQG